MDVDMVFDDNIKKVNSLSLDYDASIQGAGGLPALRKVIDHRGDNCYTFDIQKFAFGEPREEDFHLLSFGLPEPGREREPYSPWKITYLLFLGGLLAMIASFVFKKYATRLAQQDETYS